MKEGRRGPEKRPQPSLREQLNEAVDEYRTVAEQWSSLVGARIEDSGSLIPHALLSLGKRPSVRKQLETIRFVTSVMRDVMGRINSHEESLTFERDQKK